MPYAAGHRPAVKKTIIDSAGKVFNRHGSECVSIQPAASIAISRARAISTPRSSPASSPNPIGKVVGKASKWTSLPATWP
jgi:hypothetical protein